MSLLSATRFFMRTQKTVESAKTRLLEAVEKPRLFRKLKGDHVFDHLVQVYT